MSFRKSKVMSRSGVDFSALSTEELKALYRQVLQDGLHGLCSSFYEEGQQPGDTLTAEQITRRLSIMKPYIQWIRSFSCTEGNELIPRIAKSMGLKTLVGAWLSDDQEKNQLEIDGLIRLVKEGVVDVAAVGNEVLYRQELTEAELLEYIHHVKAAVPGTPVGYVDAYYEFSDHPNITEACDVILANCYPFWEGCHIDHSFLYMKDMYHQAKDAGQGKRVIITETGWPSQGSPLHGAQPSDVNFMKYFINAQKWSKEEGIEMFYFSSFDESWKTGSEGDVGAYWGIWDKHEKLKY